MNRAPFDLAEAESELVAGFHTEYSGLRWSLFFMAEYGSMFIVSALAVILFFGAWHGPIPIFSGAGFAESTWELPVVGIQPLPYIAALAGCVNFIGKATLGVIIMIWIRWTFPRLRVDQVISMCWKYCVPILAICFLGVLSWQYFNVFTPNSLFAEPAVRENWVQQPVAPALPAEAVAGGRGSVRAANTPTTESAQATPATSAQTEPQPPADAKLNKPKHSPPREALDDLRRPRN